MNFIFKLTEYQHGNQTAKFYNNALRTISAVSRPDFFSVGVSIFSTKIYALNSFLKSIFCIQLLAYIYGNTEMSLLSNENRHLF